VAFNEALRGVGGEREREREREKEREALQDDRYRL
jgi:hypothetical protein